MIFLFRLVKAFARICERIVQFIANALITVYKFLSPVAYSIRGQVNEEELYRVVVLALSGAGSVWGSLQYLYAHANEFIKDPNIVNGIYAFVEHARHNQLILSICAVLFLGDYLRRKYTHGNEV